MSTSSIQIRFDAASFARVREARESLTAAHAQPGRLAPRGDKADTAIGRATMRRPRPYSRCRLRSGNRRSRNPAGATSRVRLDPAHRRLRVRTRTRANAPRRYWERGQWQHVGCVAKTTTRWNA